MPGLWRLAQTCVSALASFLGGGVFVAGASLRHGRPRHRRRLLLIVDAFLLGRVLNIYALQCVRMERGQPHPTASPRFELARGACLNNTRAISTRVYQRRASRRCSRAPRYLGASHLRLQMIGKCPPHVPEGCNRHTHTHTALRSTSRTPFAAMPPSIGAGVGFAFVMAAAAVSPAPLPHV